LFWLQGSSGVMSQAIIKPKEVSYEK